MLDLTNMLIWYTINDIRLIYRPIHAPSHELEDADINTPPTKVISKRILVELRGIREASVILYLWGMKPLAYFRLLFHIETCWLHLDEWCTVAFDAWWWEFDSVRYNEASFYYMFYPDEYKTN